jgi:hypothetical protein
MSTFGSPWEALRGGFRKACVKRLVGDEDGAIEVLKNEIPLLVVSWAKSSSLEPSEKKAKLKEVFDDESARAEELAVAFDLFAGRFEARVASRVEESVKGVAKSLEVLTHRLEHAISALSTQESTNQETKFDSPYVAIEDEVVEEIEVESVESTLDDEIELDPPLGSGLKFDEIEEMIDDLLSSE